MTWNAPGTDEGEKEIAILGKLISTRLLQDKSMSDEGFQVVFHGGAEDFRASLSAVLAEAVADIPRDILLAILMRKAREDRRRLNEPVLPEDEPPPGFSSN